MNRLLKPNLQPPQPAGDRDAEPIIMDHCSHCGARVGGFPGDYARCTCGRMHMLPGDPPAGWRLVQDTGRLKVLPFYVVSLFYASIAAIFWTGGGTGLMGAAVVVLVFAMWIYAIMSFATAAEKQRGWWICMLEYHLSSVGFLICFFVVLPRMLEVFSGRLGALLSPAMLGACVGLVVCIVVYGDARRRVAHLRIVPA